MNPTVLDYLRCPLCTGTLSVRPEEELCCAGCGERFPIKEGIPHFVSASEIAESYPEIAEQGRRAARFYDFVSVQQFLEIIGLDVDEAREQYLGRLELRPGARVLDVGAGTGAEMIHLARRAANLRLHGLDISVHMLAQCRRKLRRAELAAELFVGRVERLPFADDTFDVVFHMGAFNEFRDKSAAVRELIRVARPGSRLAIADEWLTSENTRTPIGKRLRTTYPSMSLDPRTPLEFVPERMLEVRQDTILKGFGYCLELRKPA
jgi:ubiquinone/menaquinone biosynthesis C-methylase UbiE